MKKLSIATLVLLSITTLDTNASGTSKKPPPVQTDTTIITKIIKIVTGSEESDKK